MFWTLALLAVAAAGGSSVRGHSIDVEEEIKYIQSQRHKRFLIPMERCLPPLGCFRIDGVWSQRIINLLPADRFTINTQFYLFTRRNPIVGQRLNAENLNSIKSSNFDGSKPTKVLIHGFLESTSEDWLKRLNAEFLRQDDYNVINVNWGGLGGSMTLYTQATANTRVVGAEVALLIKTLMSATGATVDSFHIIGHSLGAHTAGYAGERIPNLGRITGLDPAEPYFENLSTQIRLDASDAAFVDVIHTDGDSASNFLQGKGGLGLMQPSGHADFYPNGGQTQPNCKSNVADIFTNPKGIVQGAKNLVGCDHMRALELFIHSINYCGYEGYACSNYGAFSTAKCGLSCSTADVDSDKCNRMGLYARKPKAPQVNYYLHTSGAEPFCSSSYLVSVDIDPTSANRKGKLLINLKGNAASTGPIALADSSTDFQAGRTYSFVVGSPAEIGKLIGVEMKWQMDMNWLGKTCFGLRLCSSDIAIKKITVKREETSSVTFCGSGLKLGEDTLQAVQALSSC